MHILDGPKVEDAKMEQPDQKVEVVDLAESPALINGRPKPARGRPPGSGSRARILAGLSLAETDEDENIGGGGTTTLSATPGRINGRPTRLNRADRAAPSRVNADKPIFTLSVAAEILALHPRTLRIYEEHGLVVPHRTQTQRRRYSQNDIKKFQFIQFLTQRRRVNLEGVKIILTMLDELRRLGITDPVKHAFPDYHEAD